MYSASSGTKNVPAELHSLTGHWQPKHLLTLNDSHSFKAVKIQGDFIWHAHPDTDELFYCISGGPMFLELACATTNDESQGDIVSVRMEPGDMFCLPKARRHRPKAERETGILVVEKVGTVNTGDEEGSEKASGKTAYVDEGQSV